MYHRVLLNNLHMKDLNPRVCGRRSCTPGYEVPAAVRDHFVLHYVTHGNGEYQNGEKCFRVHPGEIFIVHPGEITRYTADSTDPFEYIWVGFDCGEVFQEFLSPFVISMPSALPLFTQIANCHDSPVREWTICSLLYALFVEFSAQSAPAEQKHGNYVSQAVNYIRSNYSQPLQVAEIAEELGLSRHYFCRIFKEQMGCSPQEFIVSHRLEQAAQLLCSHNLPQKEIALLVGYPDVYAFSRMFKRKYGISPGQYRAKSK